MTANDTSNVHYEHDEEPEINKQTSPTSYRKKQSTQETLADDFMGEHPTSATNTSSMGRGIVRDFKQTVGTHWVGEMINFNQKTLAVSFFLFFAAIVSFLDSIRLCDCI